jgi:translation initiation factor 1
MSTTRQKVSTDGGNPLLDSPFASLALPAQTAAVPPAPPKKPDAPRPAPAAKPARRGTVHLRIEKAGRGGKTVTVIFGEGVERLPSAERESLLRSLKTTLGTGGTDTGAGTLEVRGDERPRVAEWLRRAGFTCKG